MPLGRYWTFPRTKVSWTRRRSNAPAVMERLHARYAGRSIGRSRGRRGWSGYSGSGPLWSTRHGPSLCDASSANGVFGRLRKELTVGEKPLLLTLFPLEDSRNTNPYLCQLK